MQIEKQIIDVINNNEKIKRYRELEKLVNEDQDVLNLIDELKAVQKQIVHAEKLEKKDMLKVLQEKADDINNSIFNYPVMAEYLDLQAEVNELIQSFKEVIETSLAKDLALK